MAEMKQVIQVLRDILSELAKLDDAQMENLLNKTAKFKYFDPSEVKPTKTKKEPKPKVVMDEPTMTMWREQLLACKTKEDAIRYVQGLKLTNEGLKTFAAFLHCGLFGAGKKEQMITAIVNGTVMAKLNAEAIHRI